MTVAAPGHAGGILEKVITEIARDDGENEVTLSRSEGSLAANLQIGADLTSCVPLQSNSNISSRGHELGSAGFIISPEEAAILNASSTRATASIIRPYRNGRDITDRPRNVQLIDAHGLSESELRDKHPAIYQHLLNRVKPERATNRDIRLRNYWWLHRRSREDWREMAQGLPRYIATVETSKHRFFTFLDQSILPDNKLIAIATTDSFALAVLSSLLHVNWSLKAGSWLGVGNDSVYVKSRCFETFPFPALNESPLKQRIRDLGERLDAHRKCQQELHPDLTLTGIYNVLEKLRAGEALTAKDGAIHDQGLVSVLKQLHDDLDAAVLEAYGWGDLASAIPPADILARGGPDAEALQQQILTRLVALNHERAAEEKRGLIRWLRPDYQAPGAASGDGDNPPLQAEIGLTGEGDVRPEPAAPVVLDWPADLPAQVAAIRKLLPTTGPDPEALAACFGRKNKKRADQINGILATLKALGLIA